jgi:hypothetical protein
MCVRSQGEHKDLASRQTRRQNAKRRGARLVAPSRRFVTWFALVLDIAMIAAKE